jgi:sugar O-acyltransferase (sialic acid O-acetyltransferase NeuD family)
VIRKKIVLIGAGGHARACIDVIEGQKIYQIIGLLGTPDELSDIQLGYKVIGCDNDLHDIRKQCKYALVAIGQIRTAEHRRRLYIEAKKIGFELPVIVAPDAFVSPHASIASGTVIMHGAVINAGAKIGRNCIINTNSVIEHDCSVEDHTHISTGAVLNGGVCVSAGTFVGSGSLIKQGVSIGENCVIGMGLTVKTSLSRGTHLGGRK